MVVALLAVGAAAYLYLRRNAIIDSVNPASRENVVYRGVNTAFGEVPVATATDYVFGAIDLVNPFNDSDAYARRVYNLE